MGHVYDFTTIPFINMVHIKDTPKRHLQEGTSSSNKKTTTGSTAGINQCPLV